MKIVIHNFRCHEDKSLELPDKGLVLLRGRSGTGKTTILNAVVYALYGSIKKPCHLEKKKCSVSLEMVFPGQTEPLHVHRTFPGNRITTQFAGTNYEDDAAQGLVETLLMDAEKFQLSAYVIQRLDSSVLSLAPKAQLAFVKKLSEIDEQGPEFARLAKKFVRHTEKHLEMLKGKTAVLTGSLVDLPVCSWRANLDQPESLQHQIKKMEAKVPGLRKRCELMETQYQKTVAIQQAREEVHLAQKKIDDLPAEEPNGALTVELNVLNDLLRYKIEMNRISGLETDMRKELAKAQSARKSKLLTAEEKAVRLTEIVEMQRIQATEIQAAEIVRAAKEEIKNIAQTVQEKWAPKLKQGPATLQSFLRKQLGKLEMQKEKQHNRQRSFQKPTQGPFPCPSCKTDIVLKAGVLVRFDPKASAPIRKEKDGELLKRAVDEAEKALLDAEELWDKFVRAYEASRPHVWNMNKINTHASKLEKLRRALAAAEALESTSNKSEVGLGQLLQQRRKIAQDKLSPEAKKWEINKGDLSIETLEDTVHAIQKRLQARRDCGHTRDSLTADLDHRRQTLQNMGDNGGTSGPEHTKSKWKETQMELQSCHDRLRKTQTECLEATEKVAYEEKVQKQKKCKTDLEEAHTEEIAYRKRLVGFLEIGKLCTKAELLSTQATLRALNDQAQVYLESLFEEPIVVRLERSRVTLKGKVRDEISVSVVYHGIEYDDLSQLSGGERQRCNLAFLLAVNDMVGAPILLLDECLNNLDDETHETILNFLKTLCDNKLIVAVAHEANESIFDQIVHC